MVVGMTALGWCQSISPSARESKEVVAPEGCIVVQTVDPFLNIKVPEEFSRSSNTQGASFLEINSLSDKSKHLPSTNPFIVLRQSGQGIFQDGPRIICGARGGVGAVIIND